MRGFRPNKCDHLKVIHRLKDGLGARVTNPLFYAMAKEFARLNAKYRIGAGDYPFQYTERQVEPVIFASFLGAKVLPFAQEPATTQNRGEPRTYGWIDLWVCHKEIVHLVEIKLIRLSWKRRNLGGVQGQLKRASSQLKGRKIRANDYGTRKIFKTALVVVPLYSESKYEQRLVKRETQEVIKTAQEVCTQLGPSVNWAAVWTLCEKHQGPLPTKFGNSIYPGVLLLANVTGPI